MERKQLDDAAFLTKVLQYSCNVSFEDFEKDLAHIIGGYVSNSYVQEKFNMMRYNFAVFFCNLDDDAKRRFIEQAMAHYKIVM